MDDSHRQLPHTIASELSARIRKQVSPKESLPRRVPYKCGFKSVGRFEELKSSGSLTSEKGDSQLVTFETKYYLLNGSICWWIW